MSTKTPKKFIITADDSFHLPDTPTSLASSNNKWEEDVIYPLPGTKKRKPDNSEDVSISSLQTDSVIEVTNKIKYNALHDSIESFESQSSANAHNKSIIADWKDIKKMIETKQKQNNKHMHVAVTHKSDSDLIQKWLEDRKRWDTIQQTYEEKLNEIQNRLRNKTLYFKKELDEVFKRELQYQNEIKNLNQQIESFDTHKKEEMKKLEHDYKELSENNHKLNIKYTDLQQKHIENENIIQNIEPKLKEKDCIISKLEIDIKNIQQNNKNLLQQIENLKMFDEEINEYKVENERLKHLELTSQNMVERLLKRLEQQIHSCENIQKQLHNKEKTHENEMTKLEKINAKLQEQISIFNNQNYQKPKRIMSSSSSETSLFTLSTVMTTEPKYINVNIQINKLINDIDILQKENKSLRETIDKFRKIINTNNMNNKQIKQFAKQTVLIEQFKNEIAIKNRNINEYKHSINSFETIITKQKNTINNIENAMNEQRNNIQRLEKTNSDISIELIQERAIRQNLEKEIKHLKFDNKQLKNKLITFKNITIEQSTDDEIFDDTTHKSSINKRPSTANDIMNQQQDKLLLNSLKHLINKYNNCNHSVKKNKYNTPKNTMVKKGNFIHKTVSKRRNNNKKEERCRISSMTPVSYVCVVKKNRNKTSHVSMRRKRKGLINKPQVQTYRNKIGNTSKRKKNKSKIVKVPTSMRTRSEKLDSKKKRKNICRSGSKRHIFKPCIHKHWV